MSWLGYSITFTLSALVIALGAEAEDLGRLTNDEECGIAVIPKSDTLARIVNGSTSVQGQLPWQAAIIVERDGSAYFTCGATLINNSWVLTAAHCFDDNDPVSSISVYLGMYNRDDPYETTREIRQLRNLTCHPTYGGPVSHYKDDLCLLHLSKPVAYTTYIRPACLPEIGTNVNVGDICTISGWGETEGTGSRSFLRLAQVPIINHTICATWYQEDKITVSANHMCAGYESGGTDSCQGDSGGPLVCPETVSGRNAYVLRGVTSYGLGCADPRRPGVYVDVVKYMDWIDEVVSASGNSLHELCLRIMLLVSAATCLFHFC